jgi:tetratricopeptide (TPR) repeat protein
MNEKDLLDKAREYYLDEKYEKSINCYNQVLRINPIKYKSFRNRKAYFAMGEYERAIEFYNKG